MTPKFPVETNDRFMHRCMESKAMEKAYPKESDRVVACVVQAIKGLDHIQAADIVLETTYDWSSATKDVQYKYKNPKTGQTYLFSRKGVHKKDGITLVFVGKVD